MPKLPNIKNIILNFHAPFFKAKQICRLITELLGKKYHGINFIEKKLNTHINNGPWSSFCTSAIQFFMVIKYFNVATVVFFGLTTVLLPLQRKNPVSLNYILT